MFTVLCSGWCSTPFVQASLSEAVARYLRSRDVPVLSWIGDFYVTNFRLARLLHPNQQFVAAQAAASLVLDGLYQAGYFISISKCELIPSTHLGFLVIICDAVQCRFEAPADRLEKLERILSDASTSGAITFQMLESSQATARAYQTLFPWLPYTRTTYTSNLRVFSAPGVGIPTRPCLSRRTAVSCSKRKGG